MISYELLANRRWPPGRHPNKPQNTCLKWSLMNFWPTGVGHPNKPQNTCRGKLPVRACQCKWDWAWTFIFKLFLSSPITWRDICKVPVQVASAELKLQVKNSCLMAYSLLLTRPGSTERIRHGGKACWSMEGQRPRARPNEGVLQWLGDSVPVHRVKF